MGCIKMFAAYPMCYQDKDGNQYDAMQDAVSDFLVS